MDQEESRLERQLAQLGEMMAARFDRVDVELKEIRNDVAALRSDFELDWRAPRSYPEMGLEVPNGRHI